MRVFFVLCIAALASGSVGRPSAQPLPRGPAESGFSLGAHAFLDSERRPSVVVSLEVPYSSLVFLKKGAEFRSEYTAYIKILDKKRRIVETAVLTETATTRDYEGTRSARARSKASRRFHLPRGDYIVECMIEVKDTQRAFKRETTVSVPEFLEGGIGVGKPRLYAVRADTAWGPPLTVRPAGARSGSSGEVEGTFFAAVEAHPVFAFEVYTEEEAAESVDCEVYFQVTNEARETRGYGRVRARIAGLENEALVHLDTDEWDPGSYLFVAKAVLSQSGRETTASSAFVLAYTKSVLTKHFDRTLALLSLIADEDEIRELRDASESARSSAWASFWARRDPTPGTAENEALEEHLRRVHYAATNLSDGSNGWESDRGKVYIKHGEPDYTELKIDPQYQGQYLVWYYYRENRRFVFYDRFGLGEYRLVEAGPL